MNPRNILIPSITLLLAHAPATALDIITTPPQGEKATYFADFQNFDNTFGFMGDYHSEQTITFASDGSVYIPNLLLRRTMPAYIKGSYNAAEATITVAAGQQVFLFPNENIAVALYALDANGCAGPTPGEFYTQPLVFDVAVDGRISLRSSEQFPMFGLCNAAASDEVYQNARNLTFTPTHIVTPNLTHCNYGYVYSNETTPTQSSASYHTDTAGNYWVKGFDPKYPESWIKIEKSANGFAMPSFQAVYYFATEDPIVFAAMQGNDVYNNLPVQIDEQSGIITAATADGFTVGNITPDNSGSYEIYQTYHSLTLTPEQFNAEVPEAPQFVNYSPANSSGETEFIFSAYPRATTGSMLLQDHLSFRLWVNGEPYTFSPALYRWLSSEMPLVPYTFHNYNFFSIGGPDKERRYVYFNQLPTNVATIGVELVYELDGVTTVSDRLTYDIATGQASIAGIDEIEADNPAPAVYYNLQGIRVDNPRKGGIYIRTQGRTTTKIVFQ